MQEGDTTKTPLFRYLNLWDTPRFFVVHRLDAVTSGLLVLAKDPNSANQLKDKFINGLNKENV